MYMFRPEYCATAQTVASLGGTVHDIARALQVPREHVTHWMRTIKQFNEACRANHSHRVQAAEDALYNRAVGMVITDTKPVKMTSREGGVIEEYIEHVEYDKHIIPDVRAAQAWLEQHGGWQKSGSGESTVNVNLPPQPELDLTALSDDELLAYRNMMAKLHNAQSQPN